MPKKPSCLTSSWHKFNVAFENNNSPIFGREEPSRSFQAVIEKPQDSLLTQHTMWTADRRITRPLGNKKTQSTHIVSLPLWSTNSHLLYLCAWLYYKFAKSLLLSWSRLSFFKFLSLALSCVHKSITNPSANCIWTVCERCMLQTDACGKCRWSSSVAMWLVQICLNRFSVEVEVFLFEIMFNSKEQLCNWKLL